ncbi:AraC family transcriptional regulator [Actinocatenispora thailandica]|uniref:AraC family transcriptional regulator n=1 Tax=Actinocatenispora thailandica TaxID=227318 RepID=A0A7R7DKZ9_9ACTN|nr:AraC family transcriptional regulator [Actinocatenispora thailandica]BCJ33674.1 AraC family transcriptional regulator [Actinocatenispora thailandica]
MTQDWSRYWRSDTGRIEAMHAHFERHVYHRHSHDAYSFGVTESGAQAFACRGASRVSAAGMVMAFNPEDPHDGRAADTLGFTYRMVHLGPDLIGGALADLAGRPVGSPLFVDPVLDDPVLGAALRRAHQALLPDDGLPTATPLRRAELVDTAVRLVVARGATGRPDPAAPADRSVAVAARRYLDDTYLTGLDTAELAAAAGASRFAVYRAFRAAFGLSPSDYQRQLRLRYARRLLAAGTPVAVAAGTAGFADQAHLTRWFRRCYAVTPAVFAGSTG